MKKTVITTMIIFVMLAMAAPGFTEPPTPDGPPPPVNSVPEIDASSAAIALGLLAGTVLVVIEVRRRKKQTPTQT